MSGNNFDTSEGDVLGVVSRHARILERHAVTLTELQRGILRVEASLESVVATQRETNQLLAALHSLWARLDCVRPDGRTPSSELRAVRCEEG